MTIKKVIENGDFAIARYLQREQKRLGLTPNDCAVLMFLVDNLKRSTISTAAISKRVNISAKDIGISLNNLTNLNYLTISLESKDNKMREVYSLDPFFAKIESLYHEVIQVVPVDHIAIVVDALEVFKKKPLTALELERVRGWFENNLYSSALIIKTINEQTVLGVSSFKILENALVQKTIKNDVKDVSEAVKGIFKLA